MATRILDVLVRIERALIIFVCMALALLMVVQIILRYVFVAPFLGIEEVAVLLGLWIYFLGLVHVTRTRQHIGSGVAAFFIRSETSRRVLEVFKLAVCILSSAVFLYFTVLYWIKTDAIGRSSTYLSWPTTVWITSMLFGFSIATVLFVAQLWLLLSGAELPADEQQNIEPPSG